MTDIGTAPRSVPPDVDAESWRRGWEAGYRAGEAALIVKRLGKALAELDPDWASAIAREYRRLAEATDDR